MNITQIRLKNWLCFRGEHILDIEPKPYAIMATHDDDPEASNWSGKTGLVEAIKFALVGDHRHRLDDEWITGNDPSSKERGDVAEGAGEVGLSFDTGERIVRSKEVKKAAKLYYWAKGAIEPAFKAEAQIAIDQRLMLTAKDFDATWFFAQREMARIILAKPDERMKMISAWLKLGPLERCEDKARARVNALIDDVTRIQGRRQGARERLAAALAGRSRDLAAADAKEAQGRVDGAKHHLGRVEKEWQENEARRRAKEIHDTYDRLCEEGTKLAAEVEAFDIENLTAIAANTAENLELCVEQNGIAVTNVRKLEVVARGAFDGKCPIADLDCPATKTINADRATATAKLDVEKKSAAVLNVELMNARSADANARAKLRTAKDSELALVALRARVEELAEQLEEKPDPEESDVLRQKLTQAREHVDAMTKAAQEHQRAIVTIDGVDAEEADLDDEAQGIEQELRLARAALTIFGKTGAQRRIAEEVLGQIEDDANARLATASIPLSVRVQWTREGGDPAKACEACGASFPSSAKIKACLRCGAQRGKQIQNSLDFLLSDRSGAAEDLAGIAVQLAARDWLLADRGSDWRPVVIDEAFGQLDASNRRSLAHHFSMLLGSQQAFVIAHHAQVLDALPGRIEIVRGKDSTVRVVS